MYYPRIDGNESEPEIIKMLGRQVAEVLDVTDNFKSAMRAVLTYRYAGRFKSFRRKVAQYLQTCSVESRMKGVQLDLRLK